MQIFQSEITPSVQYHGEYGKTQTGIDAVVRLIQSREWITKAILLTCSYYDHFFYIELSESDGIIIRPSFTSGYVGEGSAGLAIVLLMLRQHGVEVEEIIVSHDLFRHAAESALKQSDLKFIKESHFVRPWRISEYTYNVLESRGGNEQSINRKYKLVMPYGIIDPRILELAIKLPELREKAIFEACKLLEVQLATRCASDKYGAKLIKHAFECEQSKLMWKGVSASESEGLAKLFIGAFSSIRNPKAHNCDEISDEQAYREFMLINYLFKLESEAVMRDELTDSK